MLVDPYLVYLENTNLQKSVISVCLIILVAVVKSILKRVLVDRGKKLNKNYRSQVNTLNNSLNISLVFLILALWSSEIQQFALSIAAFMFAIVFATKEFIQCFIGYIYYLSARPFRIGDWIQVQDGVGEVIVADWTKVTLLEVDLHSNSYTGKHLFIPNNQLLLKTVKNLNFLRRYSMNQFTITCEPLIDLNPIIEKLEQSANEYCADFADVAERYKNVIEKRMDLDFISIEPHFQVHTNQYAKVCITVDLFCPVEQNLKIQQAITREFFSLWHQCLEKNDKVLLKEQVKALPEQ
ncbi:MAG: MscS family membrane protein [Glaciecola sp.]|jgi:MscS family membrane protein